MAFSEYQTIEDVIKKYPLEILNERFLQNAEITLPDLFLDNLNFALKRKTSHDNEYFFTENFIYPFITVCLEKSCKIAGLVTPCNAI